MPDRETLLIETAVHGRVLVRRPAAQRRGVLVGFHGYAEAADAMLERLESIPAAEAWTLVAIQGLNRFYRGRSEEVVAGWMTRQDREAAIADNVAYVDRALDAVLPAPPADTPLVCAGFSQGVAMAFRAAARGRRPCAAVIAVGGDVPPELLAGRSTRFPPTLLVRGESDDWYTQAKQDADATALKDHGATVGAVGVRGGHEWNAAVTAAVSAFLNADTLDER